MITPCCRCGTRSETFMSYDYSARQVWIDDLVEPPAAGTGYAMCELHANRITPPVGWMLTDRRRPMRRLFASRDVA